MWSFKFMDVVNISNHVVVKKVSEYVNYESLEYCWCISESIWHKYVFIAPPWCY